ncbi:hypothetical protein CVT24_009683, partial [Panaeolus cyanescens]
MKSTNFLALISIITLANASPTPNPSPEDLTPNISLDTLAPLDPLAPNDPSLHLPSKSDILSAGKRVGKAALKGVAPAI